MSHKKSKKGGAFPPFSASACNLRVSCEDVSNRELSRFRKGLTGSASLLG
jgi:hypothetical protein